MHFAVWQTYSYYIYIYTVIVKLCHWYAFYYSSVLMLKNIFCLFAASPQASSTLIFGLPVVTWVACGYLGCLWLLGFPVPYLMLAVSIFVCHDDFEQAYNVGPAVSL